MSFDESIATVSSSGLVTGVGEGNVWIRCTAQDGGKIADAHITVTNIGGYGGGENLNCNGLQIGLTTRV